MKTENALKNECGVEEFIAKYLPQIITGRTSLNAAFISYRPVGGRCRTDGEVVTGKKGLRVIITTGSLGSPSLVSFGLYSVTRGTAQDRRLFIEASNQEAANLLAGAQSRIADVEKNDLLVIYFGLSGFDAALKAVADIRKVAPAMKIIAVACDCELGEKRAKIAPFIESKTVDFFVTTDGCGGYGAMGDIVDSLVELWPDTEPITA